MRPVAGEALTFSESDLQIYEPNCYVVEKAISRSTATQPVFSAVPLGLKRPRYFLSRSLKQPVKLRHWSSIIYYLLFGLKVQF